MHVHMGVPQNCGYSGSLFMQTCLKDKFMHDAHAGAHFVLLPASGGQSPHGNSCAEVAGELALVPPLLGASQRLLNRDHGDVYYKVCLCWPCFVWSLCPSYTCSVCYALLPCELHAGGLLCEGVDSMCARCRGRCGSKTLRGLMMSRQIRMFLQFPTLKNLSRGSNCQWQAH